MMKGIFEKPERNRAIVLVLSVVLVSLFHFLIPTEPHSYHKVHIVLRKLYFLPPVMAGAWFGLRGAALTTLAVSIAFILHAFLDWPGNYMEQANQLGELAGFWVVGLVPGYLFEKLRESELRRLQLQTELNCAANVQKQLLPQGSLTLPGFEFAALCLPARQVGGDFYDWYETSPGAITLTFGDVMGKGMAAAMLMTSVRATLRAVTQHVQPAFAVQLAEQSLRHDLNSSESFVTLFLGQLNIGTSLMTYVDCGHGLAFLRRHDGKVEELLPRGLPLGISAEERYQEGGCVFKSGDALVVYSDGLIDVLSGHALDNAALAGKLEGAANANDMVKRIVALVSPEVRIPDDLTVLVVRKQ